MSRVGVVTIGRNEGERLVRSLRSVVGRVARVVYVDSGSSDDSVAEAEAMGVDVVALDMDRPFTAARARNAGYERLIELHPELEYVMFVDGDCEVIDGWLDAATTALDEHADYLAVFGRQKERHREASIYNRLIDMEWDKPVGEAKSSAGCVMMRCARFDAAGRFDASLIAGEEPELYVRMRREGGVVMRLDRDMTWHDADLMRFGQWWRRIERSGHAFAEGAALQGGTEERHNLRNVRSMILWAIIFPLIIVASAIATWWIPWAWVGAVGVAALYPALWFRIMRWRRNHGDNGPDARLYATFAVLAKVPEMLGCLSYWAGRMRGRRRGLIEYK